MEQTSTTASREETNGLASAAGHLKRSWEHGKDAAMDVKRKAAKSLDELSGDLDGYVKSRPKAAVFGAFGTGVILGVLTGTLVRSRAKALSRPAGGAI